MYLSALEEDAQFPSRYPRIYVEIQNPEAPNSQPDPAETLISRKSQVEIIEHTSSRVTVEQVFLFVYESKNFLWDPKT